MIEAIIEEAPSPQMSLAFARMSAFNMQTYVNGKASLNQLILAVDRKNKASLCRLRTRYFKGSNTKPRPRHQRMA